MSRLVREQLMRTVTHYGNEVVEDLVRVREALAELKDAFPEEVQALLEAQESEVVADIVYLYSLDKTDLSELLNDGALQLVAYSELEEPIAHWAIRAWSIALGIVEQEPEEPDIDALFLWAINLFHRKEVEEAREVYELILRFDPAYVAAWTGKGICHYEAESFEEALLCFETALSLDPENVYTWIRKGDTLQQLGRFPEATECYARAQEIEPDDLEAHFY